MRIHEFIFCHNVYRRTASSTCTVYPLWIDATFCWDSIETITTVSAAKIENNSTPFMLLYINSWMFNNISSKKLKISFHLCWIYLTKSLYYHYYWLRFCIFYKISCLYSRFIKNKVLNSFGQYFYICFKYLK